jgi:hypothetical protein
VVHVVSLWRPREDEVKDRWVDATDCIRLFYPNVAVFFVLGHKSSLVISFSINKTLRTDGEVSIQSSPSHPLAIVDF